eukprot:CAMPEP_0113716506 /NCGR_PEP_ID=MMETSP0038_2-20120614/33937_1 /TAXON_ID=2898 /ORGANISM="Cryptomonas paramecium" /LENGTH=145 /DNA_ID=CAMNT_0000644055 /DNA_START=18 /DNA_END=451 /DNA_ORIENTATION=- /assembly_acc=CAM_ASM_000170
MGSQRDIREISFDVMSFSRDELVDVCVEMFVQVDLDQLLELPALRNFVVNVKNRMRDNPYHNWYHVVDVAQTVFVLGLQSEWMQHLFPTERLALLIASLCHDIDHPVVPPSKFIYSDGSRNFCARIGTLSLRTSQHLADERELGR